MEARDVESAFTKIGFSNWKTALECDRGFAQHSVSKSHIIAMTRWAELKARNSSGTAIENLLLGEQLVKNRYYIKSVAEAVQFLAINELSFRGDHECVDENDTKSSGGLFVKLFEYTLLKDVKLREIASSVPKNAKYTSPEIQNEIIGTMATMVQKKIVRDFEQSDIKMFCLKCDETRDIDNTENMSLVLRFVKDGFPREHLLALVELGDVDAKAIALSIFDELKRHGVPTSALLSQCYDGASVMSGAKGGVRKFVEEEVGRSVPYLHCYNHQLHLVVVHALNKDNKARNFIAVCELLYVFLRRQLPSSVYEGTTVKRLLEQRWTGHVESARIVLKNRDAIVDALTIVSESPKASTDLSVEASGLKTKVSTPEFAAIGEIVVSILTILEPVNKMFQGKTCSMTDAMDLIQASIASLETLRQDSAFNRIMMQAGLTASAVASNDADSAERDSRPKRARIQSTLLHGSLVFSTLGHDDNQIRPSSHMKQTMFALLDNVIGEMKTRFNENNAALAKAVEALLISSPHFLDFETVLPLAELLQLQLPLLRGELSVANAFLTKKCSHESNLQDIVIVIKKFCGVFPLLHKLYTGALTIGISTATCENSFSTLARVLRPHRKSMTHSRKASLVLLAFEKMLCKDIDFDEFINIFRSQTRRIQL